MSTYSTKFSIGDEVYIVDFGYGSIVGPLSISHLDVQEGDERFLSKPGVWIRYGFAIPDVCRCLVEEDLVFRSQAEALKAIRNPQWFASHKPPLRA